MSDDELFDALDRIFTYDTGGIPIGLGIETLRERVKDELRADLKPGQVVGSRLTAFARRYTEPPYTLEDMALFIWWLAAYMDIVL